MIKNWYVTGDTHGSNFSRVITMIDQFQIPKDQIAETALIILGDAGFNFYMNKSDLHHKRQVHNLGVTVYCVHGNHEANPDSLGYAEVWDKNVQNYVYVDDHFDRIRYFKDGLIYNLNRKSVLVVGGAYSIDKFYRLQNNYPWFADEQLTLAQMGEISKRVKDIEVDFVFTHTCPRDWEPSDLFLPYVSQNEVDKTMENWMNDLKDTFSWKIWLFGHFHADRLERPGVQQMFQTIEPLDLIYDRWVKQDRPEWYFPKAPKYYMT